MKPMSIAIESKVSAPLKGEQLQRYKSTFRHVVAMCKRRPEVSRAERTTMRIAYVPWQDIHWSLGSISTREPISRFLATEFRSFLEDYGLAHTTVRVADVVRVQKTFASIDGVTGNSRVNVLALTEADAILSLASELLDEWRDQVEGFTSRRVWGPGYYKQDYDDDQGVVHQLGVAVYRNKRASCEEYVEFYFLFPQALDAPPYLWVGRYNDVSDEVFDYKEWTIESLAGKDARITRPVLVEKVLPALR